MGKSRWCATLTLVAGLFLASWPARAEGIEISPMLGVRDGGHFREQGSNEKMEFDSDVAGGILVAFDLDGSSFIEISYMHQETLLTSEFTSSTLPRYEVDIDDIQVGGHYVFGDKKVNPFIRGSLGVTRLDPTFPDTDDEIQFSFALGGGLKTMFNKHVGMRFDARLLATTLTSSEIFCIDDSCLDPKGTIIVQGEITAGMIFSF